MSTKYIIIIKRGTSSYESVGQQQCKYKKLAIIMLYAKWLSFVVKYSITVWSNKIGRKSTGNRLLALYKVSNTSLILYKFVRTLRVVTTQSTAHPRKDGGIQHHFAEICQSHL